MIWIVVVLVVAAGVGFVAHRRLMAPHGEEHPVTQSEGLPTWDLVVPVRTLAALLLAFVLLSVYTSFEAAGDESAREAGAVLSMAEDSVVLDHDSRSLVLGALQCYARSVIGPDWRSPGDDGRPSPETDAASDRITEALVTARRASGDELAASAVLSDDSLRIQSRIARLDEGKPSVPWEVTALLVATVAVMVGIMAAYAHPAIRRHTQLALLLGTTLVFGATLLVIRDLDRPYAGPAKVAPSAMRNVERRISGLPGTPAQPPCDAEGRPTDA